MNPPTRRPVRRGTLVVILASLAVLSGACDARAQDSAPLKRYALDDAAAVRHPLPGALREVSGLAATADGRLFAHGDERAEIFEIDPRSGGVLKRFSLGQRTLTGDFEGIAVAGERFFLVTSGATIVEFREGADRESVAYTDVRTRLDDCEEIEGLEHEAQAHVLLLVCKIAARGALIIYEFDLASMSMRARPRIRIEPDALRSAGLETLRPSGLAMSQAGTLLVVAAREQRLVELSARGDILGVRGLATRAHPQAEGIAVLPDGTIVIADEGGNGRGMLTLYHPRAPRDQ